MLDDILPIILNFIDIHEYKKIIKVNKQFRKIIISDPFSNKINKYIDEYLEDIQIESEERDDKHDCGIYCTILWLKNGEIVSDEEYNRIVEDTHRYLWEYFSYIYYVNIDNKKKICDNI